MQVVPSSTQAFYSVSIEIETFTVADITSIQQLLQCMYSTNAVTVAYHYLLPFCKYNTLYLFLRFMVQSSNAIFNILVCHSCFHRTSLFVGFHKHLVYAVDCFAHERVVNMDVSSLIAEFTSPLF